MTRYSLLLISIVCAASFMAHTGFTQSAHPYIEDATIESIAGIRQLGGYTGDAIPALGARLNQPRDVVFYPPNSILIADTNNHRVRKVNLDTGMIDTFAGNGINSVTGNLKLAVEAAVASPKSLAVDANGSVYIATLHQIRVVYPSGVIDLFAGSSVGDAGDGLPARQSQFSTLGGIAFDHDGNLLIADTGNNKIRKITREGADYIVSTIAGTGIAGSEGNDGPANLAQLNSPSDVGAASSGEIYIAEKFGNAIREIQTNGTITTLYNIVSDNTFKRPLALTVDDDLYVYFCGEDHYVRRYNLFTKEVELAAGNGRSAFSGEGGNINDSMVNYPAGLGLDPDGNLYIADWYNFMIRRVNIPAPQIPPTPTPTFTPSPTFTPTIGPSPTPTRTPKPRTPSPTSTPYPTATPTATPTSLPVGQLAPDIASGISEGPGYQFFANATSILIHAATDTGKVKVVLSSSPDGTGELLTQDTIALAVQHKAAGTVSYSTLTFEELGTTKKPVNITAMFAEGRNTVSVRLIDSKGAGYSSFPLYVVVFTAPDLTDIPDIRLLVNESVDNVYELDDYIFDRDTPLEDLRWEFITDPAGPDIIRGPRHSISVGPFHKPAESIFSVSASDGVFSVYEDIKVKISTFRIQQFTMPDAPLLEDFASISPYSLRFMLEPPDVNIADVPFNASFTAGKGMKAVHVAKGTIYMFPDFPGGQVTESIPIAIKGKRQSNPKDMDGVVLHTASVFSPEKSVPEKNFNFTAPHLSELGWDVVVPGDAAAGEMYLGTIPPDPVSVITDGYGVNAVVDPGENIALLSHAIELPTGASTISLWFAVEKFDRNNADLPTITIALLENSSNLSYTTIRGAEILGDSRYQFLRTTYDVIGPKVQALVQVAGTQNSGRAEVYIDNVRIFPSAREVDRALGATRLPIDFDGTFEFVLKGLGFLVEENETVSYGSSVFLQKGINRTVHPTGFNQSMILSLDQPESAIQVSIGPNAVANSLYPRELTARAHVQKVREGGGFFAIGLTNGLLESVTFISNDRLPLDPTWHSLSTSGMFTRPGLFEPMIIIQNQNIPGAFPGVILDGATLAVDDITLEAFLDSAYFWDHKALPAN